MFNGSPQIARKILGFCGIAGRKQLDVAPGAVERATE